ncbi:hypothetical protein ACMX2M_03905 [Paenibacillus polymyxa]
MWKILIDSPNGPSLRGGALSAHFSVGADTDMSEREHFFITSPHLNVLKYPEDNTLAVYKSDALMLIFNTVRKILGSLNSIPKINLQYELENGVYQEVYLREEDPILHMEQLLDPYYYEINLPPQLRESNLSKLLDLTYTDRLFREVIVLYGLSLENHLYILMNMYKISEYIEYDLKNIKKNGNTNVQALEEAMIPFRNNGHLRHFANTHAGSGLQSRHGLNNNRYDKEKPKIEEVYNKLHTIIVEWAKLKI